MKSKKAGGVRLICAMPNPGEPGVPCSMFYPDTPEGLQCAEEFARIHDRPGWGVFNSANRFREGSGLQEFADILAANGWRR